MAVTINGTTGVAVPLGSASAPAETNTTSATTGIYYPTSTTLGLSTNGTNAVTIDASQNVGIGVTPSAASSTIKLIQVGGTPIIGSAADGVNFVSNATYNSAWKYVSTGNATLYNMSNGLHVWYTNVSGSAGATFTPTEAARIQPTGNLAVNTTGDLGVVSVATKVGYYGITIRDAVSNTAMLLFQNSAGTTAGNIVLSGLTTIYGTSSDYRLKENVQPMTTGLATVSALKPVTYDWKFDGSQGEGFIAHELAEIVPYAVAGEKDSVNEDGSIKPQSVDYGKIVPHLVAAIKELSAEVEALKSKVGA